MGFWWSFALSMQFLLLYSLFFTITNCLIFLHPTRCHEDESYALWQFKERFVLSKSASYNPFSYPKTTSWNATSDCCSWDGIKCDKQAGHVISIDLSSSQIYGTMDANSSLFHLKHLQRLNLADNDFNYSQIPSRIGELSQLRYLNLSKANFFGEIPQQVSGSFPSSFGNLTQLRCLDIRYNKFKGHLSSFLVNLTKLRTLEVGFNEFTSDTISWICKLSGIHVLNLNLVNIGNEIPLCFANLTHLSVLSISHSNLSGQIPSWIMNLTNIVYIDLAGNNLLGEIPNSLFKLENLEILCVNDNLLEGELELLMLKMLIYIDLSSNKLTLISRRKPSNVSLSRIQLLGLGSCNLNEFPKFLQELVELSCLYMPNNNVNSFPSWMWGKTSLRRLDVSENSLTGKISPLICNLKSLMHLDLSFNNLSGMVPSCLGSSSQSLKILVLKGNKLFGSIPQTYMITSSLRMIDLSNNNLQGQLPRALVNCRMLEYIDVSHNQINDSFPFWLGTLPELKVVALSHNHLYGSIRCPTTCTFLKLHIIDLSHNQFSGSLPSKTIQNWKSMKASNKSELQYEHYLKYKLSGRRFSWVGDGGSYSFTMFNKGMVMVYQNLQEFYNLIAIDISSNKFSGVIPDVMGDLTGLVLLNLSNNMLSGRIPSSLGKLSNLEALDLSLNSLSGKIPQQLAELTFLSYFNVSFNNLSGPIPQNKQFATFQGSSFEGNQGLCGNLLSKKCEDHSGSPFAPPSAFDDDQDLGFFIEFDWKVVLIGYGTGFLVGVALGSTFSHEIFARLKRVC